MKQALALIVLCFAAVAQAAPQILLFPAVGKPTEVTVQGRVLKESPSRGSSVLSRNLRRLLASDWEGAPVELSFNGETVQTRAGNDGVFSATFRFDGKAAPEPGWVPVRAAVPGASASAMVRVIDPRAPFVVISDFDDTVAVSNVVDRPAFLRAALLQDFNNQPAVPGMSAVYRCLAEQRTPLAFVSGSPHQYAPRIAAFLSHHSFPPAALYLRDLGPDTLSGYKQPTLRRLLASFDQKVILVGDSGEHDPEVYAEIAREYPDRVMAIYIRDVGRSADARRFEGMVLFKEAQALAKDAVARGLMAESCRARAFDVEAAR